MSNHMMFTSVEAKSALNSSNVITKDNVDNYKTLWEASSPIDLADFIQPKPLREQLLILEALSPRTSAAAFEYLSFPSQKEILQTLPENKVASLLNALSPDDRTNLLAGLPKDLVSLLLKYLSPEERDLSIKLLGYPADSVGRLMTPDYIAVKMDWTVKQVIDYIRANGKDSETINVIYAIDDKGILVDDFRIRQFLLASFDAKVSTLSDHRFVALNVNDNKETAINIFRRYGRVALPVIDSKGKLLGIVTADDIVEAAVQVNTEDFQKFGGVAAFTEPYMTIPITRVVRKRIGWLAVLFVGELMTASVMGYFEYEIAQAVVLALFLPLIISSGGNAGSQASTLIVRSMALGEIAIKDWWRVMRREIIAGTSLGVILGAMGFFRVTIWSYLFHMYGEHWRLVAATIFFSLIGVVLWGALCGAMLPLVLKRFGFDPAVSSAPFVATLVDVTGLIIYFSISLIVLHGTLL